MYDDPFGQSAFGQDPFGQDPFGQDFFSQNVLGNPFEQDAFRGFDSVWTQPGAPMGQLPEDDALDPSAPEGEPSRLGENLLWQFLRGGIEGFTTFEVGEDAHGTLGQIANSLGRAAGFIGGILPTPGALASLGVKLGGVGVLRALGMGYRAERMAATAARFKAAGDPAVQLAFRSVPFQVADAVMARFGSSATTKLGQMAAVEQAGAFGIGHAAQRAGQFLQGGRGAWVAREAVRQGIAGGVSQIRHPWASEDNQGFAEGALMGGAEGLGFGLFNVQASKVIGTALHSSDVATKRRAHMLVRAAANAAWGGGMASAQGADAPMVLYHAALGGVFGIIDTPFEQEQALRFLRTRAVGSDGRMDPGLMANADKLDGYADLDPAVRAEVDFEAKQAVNRAKAVVTETLRGAGAEDSSGRDPQAVGLTRYWYSQYQAALARGKAEGLNDADAEAYAETFADGTLNEGMWDHLQQTYRGMIYGYDQNGRVTGINGGAEILARIDEASAPGPDGGPMRASVLWGPHAGTLDGGNQPLTWDGSTLRVDPWKLRDEYDPESGEGSYEFMARRMLETVLGEEEGGQFYTALRTRLTEEQAALPEAEQGEVVESPESTATPDPTSDTGGNAGTQQSATVQAVEDVMSPAALLRSQSARLADLERERTAREAAMEHDVPLSLAHPLEDVVSFVSGRLRAGAEAEGIENPRTSLTDVRAVVYTAFSNDVLPRTADGRLDDRGFEAVLGVVGQRYGIDDLSDPAILSRDDGAGRAARALRRSWTQTSQSTQTKQGVIEWTGAGQTPDAVTMRLYGEDGLAHRDPETGEIVGRMDAPTHLETSLARAGDARGVVRVSEIVLPGGKRQRLLDLALLDNPDDLFAVRGVTWAEAALAFSRQGMPLIGGIKDKGEALALERFAVPLDEAFSRLEAKADALEAAKPGEGDALYAEADRMARLLRDADPSLDQRASMDLASRLLMENVGVTEAKGGAPLERLVAENEQGANHLLNATTGNQRAQLDMDGNPHAVADRYSPRHREQGGFASGVIDARDVQHLLPDGYRPFVADEAGNAQVHHLDGVTFVHPTAFDAMLADGGYEPGSGLIKGSVAFTDDAGEFMGKQAFVVAPPRLAEAMERVGLDHLYTSESAKVMGRRSSYGLRVGKNGGVRFVARGAEAASQGGSFVVPFEGVRMNPSVREDPKKQLAGNVLAPRQMLANPVTPGARARLYEGYVEASLQGDAETNARFWQALSRNDAALLGDFDVEDLGVREILHILSQPDRTVLTERGGLYGRVLGALVRAGEEDPSLLEGDGDVSDARAEQAMRDLREATSGGERILRIAMAKGELTPAVANMEAVRPYVDTLVRNHLTRRALKPRATRGYKAFLGPVDPEMMAGFSRTGGDSIHERPQQGFQYLADGWREMPVTWLDGSTRTLESAFNEWREMPEGPAKMRAGELLTFATVRVPADSPSGTRALRFGGFTGRRGMGIVVHNDELIYKGGADLDGDSVFTFQNPDRVDGRGRLVQREGSPLMEELRASARQFDADPKAERHADRVSSITDATSPENLAWLMRGSQPQRVAPPLAMPVAGPTALRGGFGTSGRGTPLGDAKDQAMRDVASSAIVEMDGRNRGSSSRTSLETLGAYGGNGGVVMLARNGSLRGKALRNETIQAIRTAHEDGARFVVGDMPGVDEPMIRLLDEIGASYEVYHGGSQPRIAMRARTATPPVQRQEQAGALRGTAAAGVSPVARFEAAQAAFQGNRTLGGAATAGARGQAWLETARSESLADRDAALTVVSKKGTPYRAGSIREMTGIDLTGRVKALTGLSEPEKARLHIELTPVAEGQERAFYEARRTAMNAAADAAKLPPLAHSNYTIGSALASRLVDGVTVQVRVKGKGLQEIRLTPEETATLLEKVGPTRTAAWQNFANLFRLGDGFNPDGPRRTTEQTLTGLSEAGVDTGIVPARALARLGTLTAEHYRPRGDDGSGHTDWFDWQGYSQNGPAMQRLWGMAGDPEAEAARTRTAHFAMPLTPAPKNAASWRAQNDMLDVASAGLLNRRQKEAADAGVTDERAVELAVKADEIRRDLSRYWTAEDRGALQTDPEQILLNAEAYGQGLPEAERRLFSAHLIASLRPQLDGAGERLVPGDDVSESQVYRGRQSRQALMARVVDEGTLGEMVTLYNETVRLSRQNRTGAPEDAAARVAGERERRALLGFDERPIADPADSTAPVEPLDATAEARRVMEPPAPRLADPILEDVFALEAAAWERGGLSTPNEQRARWLVQILEGYPEVARKYAAGFAGTVREERLGASRLGVGVAVAPSRASVETVDQFINAFRDRLTGRLLREEAQERLAGKKPVVPRWAYILGPRYTDRYLRGFEAVAEPVASHVLTGEAGSIDPTRAEASEVREVIRFTTTHRGMTDLGIAMGEGLEAELRTLQNEMRRETEYLRAARMDGEEGALDAGRFHEAFVAARGKIRADRMLAAGVMNAEAHAVYVREYEPYEAFLKEQNDRVFLLPTKDGQTERVTGADLIARRTVEVEDRVEGFFKRWVRPDVAVWKEILVGHRGPDGKRQAVRWEVDAHGNEFPLGVDAAETLKRIRRRYGQRAGGERGGLPEIGIDGLMILQHQMEMQTKSFRDPESNNESDTTTLQQLRAEGRHDAAERAEAWLLDKVMPYRFTGYQPGYWPHLGYAKKQVEREAVQRLQRMIDDGADEKDIEAAKRRYQDLYARGHYGGADELSGLLGGDTGASEALQSLLLSSPSRPYTGDAVAASGTRQTPGNLRSREDVPMPGWNKGEDALVEYGSRLVSAYYRRMMALMNKQAIDAFEAHGRIATDEGDTTRAWARFLRLKARDLLGYPATLPREYLDDPDLGLRGGKANPITGNPYNLFTEAYVERRARWADATFFGGRWFGEASKAAFSSDDTDAQDAVMGDAKGRRLHHRLAQFSRLEAKWAMLSLLARPRGYVYNLTQHTNTLISTGYSPFKRALSLGYLQRHVNPDWHGWDDVRKWVESHGVVPEFIAAEFGNVPGERQAAVSAAMSDVSDYISSRWKNGKDADDRTIEDIVRKHGVLDIVESAGSWFMRASERKLRMTSFLAHYIKARQVLEADGFTPDETRGLDDPLLIDYAKRGVRGTQFIYAAAARPMFASTALGRVAARFQQWAWQSVAFQRDVMRDAADMGYRLDTEEGQRFQRLATANVLGLALSGVFASGIFEATLPQPLGWAKQIAEAIFGEEDEQFGQGRTERAFRPVTPAITRLGRGLLQLPETGKESFALLMGMDGADPFASYQAWSILPFGLLMRDAGMVARSPMSLVDRATGFPLFQMQRDLSVRVSGPEAEIDVFDLEEVREVAPATASTLEAYGRLKARGAAISRAAQYEEPELIRALKTAGGAVTFTDPEYGRIRVALHSRETKDGQVVPQVRVTTPDLDRR